MNGSGKPTRTPQPPPVDTNAVKSRSSRSSTPKTGSSTHSAPTVSVLVGAKSSGQAKPRNNNNSNTSPRFVGSTQKPTTANEPATDEDDDLGNRFAEETPSDMWLRESQVALAAMDKQIQDATKRNQKNENRYRAMRDSMIGKGDRMDTLQGAYASMSRELDELKLLSSVDGDVDQEALNELYLSIPLDQRSLPLDQDEP